MAAAPTCSPPRPPCPPGPTKSSGDGSSSHLHPGSRCLMVSSPSDLSSRRTSSSRSCGGWGGGYWSGHVGVCVEVLVRSHRGGGAGRGVRYWSGPVGGGQGGG